MGSTPDSPLVGRILWMVALASILLASTFAQDGPDEAITLRYRFDRLAGKTAVYTVETELRQSVEHSGQPTAEGVRWRRDTLDQRYERRGVDGRIRQTVTRIELRIETPDGEEPIRFDSKTDKAPPEGLERVIAKLNAEVIVEMTPLGVIERVRGAADQTERAAYEASFLAWPKEPVAVGYSWTKLPLQRTPYPPFGTLVYATTYRLQSSTPPSEGRSARRRFVATTIVLFEPDPKAAEDAPKVAITEQSSGGTLVFDGDGLLIESRFHSELVITITKGDTVRVERAVSETAQRLRSLRSNAERKDE